MQVAYERALASGADRLRIDRAQARWRLKRNSTADAERLAKLYRARIRQLEDARRRR